MAKLHLPSFWYATDRQNKRSPLVQHLLWPLSKLYQFGCFVDRTRRLKRRCSLPTICVGNVTMGGAGKTPTARAIMQLVKEHNKFHTVCFLMRGYGGNKNGPIEVDPTIHTAWDVGDEALMQARYAPVIVSKNRYKGAKLAKEQGYDMIIMDDGFQNAQLKKDLSFIVVDGGFGFGNGAIFPAGPLREPVTSGIKRANAAIIINRQNDIDLSALGHFKHYDASTILHTAGDNSIEPSKDQEIIAFAGIARPEKFFNALTDNGYRVHAHYAFPDHHLYTHGDMEKLWERAQKINAPIITTEKDWIRLSETWRERVSYLKISVSLGDNFKKALFNALDKL